MSLDKINQEPQSISMEKSCEKIKRWLLSVLWLPVLPCDLSLTSSHLQAVSFITLQIVAVRYYMHFQSWLAWTRMYPINKANSIPGDKLS